MGVGACKDEVGGRVCACVQPGCPYWWLIILNIRRTCHGEYEEYSYDVYLYSPPPPPSLSPSLSLSLSLPPPLPLRLSISSTMTQTQVKRPQRIAGCRILPTHLRPGACHGFSCNIRSDTELALGQFCISFQRTSWLGVCHDIDSCELDRVTPIWHYFSPGIMISLREIMPDWCNTI